MIYSVKKDELPDSSISSGNSIELKKFLSKHKHYLIELIMSAHVILKNLVY